MTSPLTGFYLKRRVLQKRLRNLNRKKAAAVSAGTLILLIFGFWSGYVWGDVIFNRSIPVTVASVPEINRLIEKVSRHIAVNVGENPLVATVQDANLLKTQNPIFYKDAEEGDRMLVWSDRAVLYSIKRDMVLAATILTPPPTQNSTDVKSLNFELRNGSGKPGAAKMLAEQLKESGFTVMSVAEAARVYQQTKVIALSDRAKSTDLQTVMSLLGGTAGELSPGEEGSQADVLVILGTDQR